MGTPLAGGKMVRLAVISVWQDKWKEGLLCVIGSGGVLQP